jgi:hypothetical protein
MNIVDRRKRAGLIIVGIAFVHFAVLLSIYAATVAQGGIFEIFRSGGPSVEMRVKEILEYPLVHAFNSGHATSDWIEIVIIVVNSFLWGASIYLIGSQIKRLFRRATALRACGRPMGR